MTGGGRQRQSLRPAELLLEPTVLHTFAELAHAWLTAQVDEEQAARNVGAACFRARPTIEVRESPVEEPPPAETPVVVHMRVNEPDHRETS